MEKQTYYSMIKESDREIIDFMNKYPKIYGKMKSIQEFFNYHNNKNQEEIDNLYEQGWDGE